MAEAIEDHNLYVQQELRRLAMLEVEYWNAWERSQAGKETSVNEKFLTATRTEQKTEEAAFLTGIQKVIDTRCKLLGLYPTDDNSTAQVQLRDAQLAVIGGLMQEAHDPSH